MSPLDGSPAAPLPAALPPRPAFALGPDHLCASVSRTPFGEPRYIATPARAETLDRLAARWLPDPVLRAHAVARVDGREIPVRAWGRVTPQAGSFIELAVRPGQRGKNPLATILQIALLAGALAISGGALGGLLGTTNLFAAGSISAGLAAAAFTVAGSYLINAIAPPPDLGLNRGGAEVSPTYFINAARNQLRLGAPVPAIHGRHRMVPPLGGSYVREVRGDDLWLRGIVVWGIGPVEISDVRIGDTPFDQFAGTTIQHYPGDGTATPLSLYPNAPTELDVGATLSNAAGWIRRTTNANAEEISVDVDFPQGLARVNPKNGRLEARTVALEVRWAPADGSGNPVGSWRTVSPTPAQADAAGWDLGAPRVGGVPDAYTFDEWAFAVEASSGGGGGGGGSGGSWSHTRSERKPFRRSRRWAVPRQPHGYVVEMRRVTPDTPDNDLEIVDTCVWSILRSVFMRAPVRDPWIAYSAFEIRASDQLNSVVDELNAVVERLYPDFDADGLKGSYGDNGGLVGDWVKSRLPAHAVVDAMTGKGRQRPFGPDQMDFVFFDGWRQWCADNDRFFDHVVDYETTASRFIRTAMAAGQAGPLWRGAQLSGVIDAPRPVRRMLTARSMRRFSATLTFPGEIHGLSTEFLNEEQGWQLDTATVYVPGRGPENATRIERMPSPGKTRPEEVQTWLAFHLASMLLQSRERFEIETDLPAFAVRRGERQLISHDVVRAGTGARVIDVETDSAGDVTAVLLDEEIDILAGADYGMRWREPVPDPGSAEPGQMVWSIRDTAPVSAAAGRTARMAFASPRPPQDAPFEGDEVVVGPRFAEAEDVVVLGVLRGDDRASTLLAVPYGETRFSGDIVIPDFATSVQNPFKARPPRPRPAGEPYASDDGIAVPFTIETGATVPVARFIARWRRTPDGSETDGGFDALPNLASDERRVILPAGDPAQPYDLDLWSEDYDGRRSEPLELRALVASEFVPAPDLVDAQGGHDETEGAKLPALTVRWDPYTNPEIANLRIAIRNPGQGVDDFEEIVTADPGAGEKTTRDVPRGRTVEVGARFRSRRGGFSQWAVWPDPVEIPAELVASDSQAIGGKSAQDLTDELAQFSLDINAVADGVAGLYDVFGSTESAAASAAAAEAAYNATLLIRDNVADLAETVDGQTQAAIGAASSAAAARDGAETFATAAQASLIGVTSNIRRYAQPRLASDLQYWTNAAASDPDSTAPAGGSIVSTTAGPVWERNVPASSQFAWHPKAFGGAYEAGRVIEITARLRCTVDNNGSFVVRLGVAGNTAAFGGAGNTVSQVTSNLQSSAGWQTFTARVTLPASAPAAWWRARMETDNQGAQAGTIQLAWMDWRDVTAEARADEFAGEAEFSASQAASIKQDVQGIAAAVVADRDLVVDLRGQVQGDALAVAQDRTAVEGAVTTTGANVAASNTALLRAQVSAQSGDNMLRNGSFATGDLWTWSTGAGIAVLDKENPPASPPGNLATAPTRHVVRIEAANENRSTQHPSTVLACKPGDVFTASCRWALNGSEPAPQLRLITQYRRADGSFISNEGPAFQAGYGGWQERTETSTAPAEAAYVTLVWQRNATSGGAMVLATDFRLTRTDAGTLAARGQSEIFRNEAVGARNDAQGFATAAGTAQTQTSELRDETQGLYTATVDQYTLTEAARNAAEGHSLSAQSAARLSAGQSRRYTTEMGLDAFSSATTGIDATAPLGGTWTINPLIGQNYGPVFQTTHNNTATKTFRPRQAIRAEVGKRYRVIFAFRYNGEDTGGSSGEAAVATQVRKMNGDGTFVDSSGFETHYVPVQFQTYTVEQTIEGDGTFPYFVPIFQVRGAWGPRTGTMYLRWIIVEEDTATVSTHERALKSPDGSYAGWRKQTGVGPGSETILYAQSEDAGGTVSSEIGLGARLIALWNNVGNTWQRILAVVGGNVHITNKLFLGDTIELDPAVPCISFRIGSSRLAIGVGFGSASNLILWFGSNLNLNQMTTANSMMHMTTGGLAYFGGDVAAGVQASSTTRNTPLGLSTSWTVVMSATIDPAPNRGSVDGTGSLLIEATAKRTGEWRYVLTAPGQSAVVLGLPMPWGTATDLEPDHVALVTAIASIGTPFGGALTLQLQARTTSGTANATGSMTFRRMG